MLSKVSSIPRRSSREVSCATDMAAAATILFQSLLYAHNKLDWYSAYAQNFSK